jgi:hypothetical protein
LGEVRTAEEIGCSFYKDISGAERLYSEYQIGRMKGII